MYRVLVVVMNGKLLKRDSIDFVQIYPHMILFVASPPLLRYCEDYQTGIVEIKPDDSNTVCVSNLNEDVDNLFKFLKTTTTGIVFVKFNVRPADACQILENLSLFLKTFKK